MELTCPSCGTEVQAFEIETDLQLVDGELETNYQCPKCDATFADIEQLR